MFKYYLQLAFERRTLIRALRVALLVGILLNLINNPSLFYAPGKTDILRVLLTFLVPYGVSTYSSVLSNYSLKKGAISNVDAVLECKNCKETRYHVHVGEKVETCPRCQQKTRWRIIQRECSVVSTEELLQNLTSHSPDDKENE